MVICDYNDYDPTNVAATVTVTSYYEEYATQDITGTADYETVQLVRYYEPAPATKVVEIDDHTAFDFNIEKECPEAPLLILKSVQKYQVWPGAPNKE